MSRIKNLPSSWLWAGGILLACIIWVASGALFGNGHSEAAENKPLTDTANAALAQVRVQVMTNTPHAAELTLRGRTEAELKVLLKSETAGRVSAVPTGKGQPVKAGDVICQLDVGARQAQLDQARARLRQTKLEYDAAIELSRKGHRSETQVAAAKATYEGAEAGARAAEDELRKTGIAAPFDGIVDNRMVQVGDYMTPGTPCAWVVGADPFHVVGAVSESQIRHVQPGTLGSAALITGETVDGKVTFLASAADPATRTFRIEMTVPNPGGTLRDGVTADIRIHSNAVPAMRVSPAILSLDEQNRVGVKTVDAGSVVRFVPVAIIADDKDGMWISGIPDNAQVIIVGQDYVKDGESVMPVVENPSTAAAAPTAATN